ncbi:hypothetical protein RHMOL_Rhmol04G0200100 [Rhododendron molle]|uniref:Uncharacterized protein n=1 Tax=Rhododendron molle TaxID=49168 RepID=A0ACC0P466_RHOML|nr:hypothetical protein RHMOL_Rhmol04G0200100 [Rhododendron molle]
MMRRGHGPLTYMDVVASSETWTSLRPPPLTTMLTEVELAGSLLSISSFTAEIDRRINSPTMIRFTTDTSMRWIFGGGSSVPIKVETDYAAMYNGVDRNSDLVEVRPVFRYGCDEVVVKGEISMRWNWFGRLKESISTGL